MICPFCEHKKSKIIATNKFLPVIRRNRLCLRCGLPWRTFEQAPACPSCKNMDSYVMASLRFETTVVRSRRCPACSRMWKTYEIFIDSIRVVKKVMEESIQNEQSYKRKRS